MSATQNQSFGAMLRTFRVSAGLSQAELAERAHLSPRTVSDLERGITMAPYRHTVVVLSDALELAGRDRAALEDAVDRSRKPSTAGQEPGATQLDPLLATKLAIPPARAALVPRPHLVKHLQTGLNGPLTLISAPAGSGKSTLLSAWRTTREGEETPLAWVSLDQGDNRPPRFWRYVLTALDRAVPGVGKQGLVMLDSSGDPPIEAVLTGVLNALSTHSGDVVLMLDDYHVIENRSIHDALAFLLERRPACLHVLLATRADPPLPLARLRARGAVSELRAADLRFSVEDTAAFLTSVMGLSLSAEAVGALETRTEGWIAGLQLAGLSLQGRSAEDAATFIRALSGSQRYIVDYLLDEVLLRQPEEVQRFLLHTCILDRLCAALCATLIDGEDPPAERVAASQEILEWLERHNVFLIALDDERRWYRYHYLFADALRQRQSGHTAIPDVSVLHQRASVWFERQGLLEEAIEHALAGGCQDWAADLIQRAVEPLAFRGETQTIAPWLRALPEATLRARPQLSMHYSWLLADTHDLRGGEEYLNHAEAALDTAPKPAQWASMGSSGDDRENLRSLIGANRAFISVMQGDAARAVLQAQAALDGVDDTNVGARSLAGVALGLAHLRQGAAGEAAEAFSSVTAVNRATNIGLFIVLAAVGEASAQRMAGDLGQARIAYEQAIAWGNDPSHPFLLVGSLYTGLADVLREQQSLDMALECATQGLQLSNELGAARAERWIEWHVCDLLVLARVKQAQGDLDGALADAHEAQEQLRGVGAISVSAIVAAFEAQLHLARGDLNSAVRWLESTGTHEAPLRFGLTPQVYVYTTEHLEIAPIQVLIAQGRASRDPSPVQRARALLDRLQEQTEVRDESAPYRNLIWLRAKALTLQALACQVLGEMPAALAPLEQALALAQPSRSMRLFLDEGLPLAALLREQVRHGANPGYAATVLAILEGQRQGDIQQAGQPPGAAARSQLLTDPLTARELDVLRLLAAGQSTPEIARTLYVEVNTVRTHVKHLYDKLEVHSRDQAVWRARELGLL